MKGGSIRRQHADPAEGVATHPDRQRSQAHRRFVARCRCTICGRQPPSDPHHLKFAQPRAMALKSGDQYCVPLCRWHHDEVEDAGDEAAWWGRQDIDPLLLAAELWLLSSRDSGGEQVELARKRSIRSRAGSPG